MAGRHDPRFLRIFGGIVGNNLKIGKKYTLLCTYANGLKFEARSVSTCQVIRGKERECIRGAAAACHPIGSVPAVANGLLSMSGRRRLVIARGRDGMQDERFPAGRPGIDAGPSERCAA